MARRELALAALCFLVDPAGAVSTSQTDSAAASSPVLELGAFRLLGRR